MQRTNKVLDTGLASLTKAPGALSRGSKKHGQKSEHDGSPRSRESARKKRERERKRERDKKDPET